MSVVYSISSTFSDAPKPASDPGAADATFFSFGDAFLNNQSEAVFPATLAGQAIPNLGIPVAKLRRQVAIRPGRQSLRCALLAQPSHVSPVASCTLPGDRCAFVNDRIAARCEVIVGGVLVLVRALLIALARSLIVIRPGLILVARRLVAVTESFLVDHAP